MQSPPGNAQPGEREAKAGEWQFWCRMCAKTDSRNNTNVLLNEDPFRGGGSQEITLKDAIERFFAVKISKEDLLPKVLCSHCFTLITTVTNYNDRVWRVQRMFNNLISSFQDNYCDLDSVRLKFGICDESVPISFSVPDLHCIAGNEIKKPVVNDEKDELLSDENLEISSCFTRIKEEAIGDDVKRKKLEVALPMEECREVPFYEDSNGFKSSDEKEDPFSSAQEDMDYNIGEDIKNIKKLRSFSKHKRKKETDGDFDNHSENAEIGYAKTKQRRKKSQGKSKSNCQVKRRDIELNIPCKECNQMFDCFPTYRQHLNAAHGLDNNLKDWKCPLCGKILTSASRLEQHVKSHLENKREFRTKTLNIKLDITCRECSEKFDCFEKYHQHLNSAHGQLDNVKDWKCPSCEKVLTSVHRLEQHLRSHVPREPKMLPCSKCGAHFPTNGRLNAHIKNKHNTERFMCEECGLCLSTSSNLKFHMLTHTDIAPLECEVCKKRFKYARRLKIHMETHDSQKHICNICGLQLNTRITLRRHMVVHNDIMKYKCDFCGRSFRQKKTLKYHLISHAGLKPYTCDLCDRAFTNGANCRLHKQKIHPEEWAALEAAGRTKNIVQRLPNIETLKTLTRVAGNVTSLNIKQGANFRLDNSSRNPNDIVEKE